jgi:hypothetical protein
MNMTNEDSPELSVQGMQEAVKLKTHAAQKRTLMTKARKDFKARSRGKVNESHSCTIL